MNYTQEQTRAAFKELLHADQKAKAAEQPAPSKN
jgi:hypothetical protein